MTITIRKLHLAVVVLAVVLIAPATAVATHIFTDVPDDQFYSDAVEWAFDNGITTGTSATTFEPDRSVTRGENVTFAKRYDDNIVQPALADIAADTSQLESSLPLVEYETTVQVVDNLTSTVTSYETVDVTAASDGQVTIFAGGAFIHTGASGSIVVCGIFESTAIDPSLSYVEESVRGFETDGVADDDDLMLMRTFDIEKGETITYVLACREINDGGLIYNRSMTALFTPAS